MRARSRDFAKARGTRAKTDQIDADVLAAYGAALQPPPTRPPTAAEHGLQEHVRCRQRLLELLINLRLQAASLTVKALQRVAQAAIRTLEKQLKAVEGLIAALQKADADFDAKVTKLTAVVGVGRQTAWSVLAEMPELGRLGRRQAASLAGLAPHPRESGTWKGKRSIGGGRPAVRKGLYMAALAALRKNPILKAVYQRLREAGKPPKLAITAVMRKLLLLLNSILKNPDFKLQTPDLTQPVPKSLRASMFPPNARRRGHPSIPTTYHIFRKITLDHEHRCSVSHGGGGLRAQSASQPKGRDLGRTASLPSCTWSCPCPPKLCFVSAAITKA